MGTCSADPGTGAPRLRALLDAGRRPVLAPGAYDALSARLVEQAGFDAVYMTGFGTTASLLGRPDVGLLGQAEMVDNARRMVAVVDVPLIADADTGYGNPINVVRTVREYEQAGVAGAAPRGPGHAQAVRAHGRQGRSCRPRRWSAKIRAAVDARTDPDLVLIARTDVAPSRASTPAIERARALRRRRRRRALRRGADLRGGHRAGRRGAVRAARWCSTGPRAAAPRRSPLARLRELGFALVLFPVATLLAAARRDPRDAGAPARRGHAGRGLDELRPSPGSAGWTRSPAVVGIDEVRELEERYRA